MSIRDELASVNQQIDVLTRMVSAFKLAADESIVLGGSPNWHAAKMAQWQKRADDHEQQAKEHFASSEKHLAMVTRATQKRTRDAHEVEAMHHRTMAAQHQLARDAAISSAKYHSDCMKQ